MCVPVRSSSISASHGNGGDVVHMPQPCSSWHSLPLPIATTETNRMKPITVEDVQQVSFVWHRIGVLAVLSGYVFF